VNGSEDGEYQKVPRQPVIFPKQLGSVSTPEGRAASPDGGSTKRGLDDEPGSRDKGRGGVPGCEVISAMRGLVIVDGRGAEKERYHSYGHGGLMALESLGLSLRLGRGLKGENAIGKAQDGECVESGMERKPGEAFWVVRQNDGPCRQKQDQCGTEAGVEGEVVATPVLVLEMLLVAAHEWIGGCCSERIGVSVRVMVVWGSHSGG